jgi:hypothetical protein
MSRVGRGAPASRLPPTDRGQRLVPFCDKSPIAHQSDIVTNRLKTIFCVGLVLLGLVLTIPWWALIGWLAVHLVGSL